MTVHRVKVAAAALMSVAFFGSPGAQSPPPSTTPATGLILGRVVDATTGQPVKGAMVTLATSPIPGASNPGSDAARVLTGSDGFFVFSKVAKNRYTISASKSGYVAGSYAKRTANGRGNQPLYVEDGQKFGDLVIPMWKYAAISGTVVDETNEPLAGISIKIQRRALASGRRMFVTATAVRTDDRGQFRAGSLVPGDYVVTISSVVASVPSEFMTRYLEASRSGDQDFVRSAQAAGATVSFGGAVRVGSMFVQPGLDALAVSSSDQWTAMLPNRGDGPLFVYPATYYPGAAAIADATVISLGSGEERTGVALQLRPVPSLAVSGTILGPDGPAGNTGLMLVRASPTPIADPEAATTVSDGSGAFTFLGVTPGAYMIRALRAPPRPAIPNDAMSVVQVGGSTVATVFPGATPPAPIPDLPTFWAETPVTIGSRDVSGVTVSLVPGARLSGRLVFNGTSPRPSPEQLQRLTVNLTPVGDDIMSTAAFGGFHIRTAQVTATGEIRSYQIPPGSYLIRASPLPGWTFADAMLDGTDVSSIPFDAGRADVAGIVVSFTDKPAELAGTVRDGMRPDGTATVLIFPTDERGWRNDPGSRRLRTAAAGPDGSFRFAAVPVGEYFAIAVRDADVEEWEAPATLARLAALATRLTIAEGESRVQDLTVKQMRSR